jgi:hypothetical protein
MGDNALDEPAIDRPHDGSPTSGLSCVEEIRLDPLYIPWVDVLRRIISSKFVFAVEQALNPDLIETREEALALVDADLITIQDYLALCRFKSWNSTGQTSALTLTHQAGLPVCRNAHSHREVGDVLRWPVQRSATVPEVSRRETPVPARGQVVRLSLKNA